MGEDLNGCSMEEEEEEDHKERIPKTGFWHEAGLTHSTNHKVKVWGGALFPFSLSDNN